MRVLVFGATGMIGRGVLRECLLHPNISHTVAVGRTAVDVIDPTLIELHPDDLFDLSPYQAQLSDFDATFWCLGVSSVGVTDEEYVRLTYDLTLNAARHLLHWNPTMTFVYVSGEGTDQTGKSRSAWARVKGKTEADLNALTSKAYAFRFGLVEPRNGEKTKTLLYSVLYKLLRPIIWIIKKVSPETVTDTRQIGLAMIHVAEKGAEKKVLHTADIRELALAYVGQEAQQQDL